MKIMLNIKKRHLVILVALIVLFAGVVVWAAAPNPGHDASEISGLPVDTDTRCDASGTFSQVCIGSDCRTSWPTTTTTTGGDTSGMTWFGNIGIGLKDGAWAGVAACNGELSPGYSGQASGATKKENGKIYTWVTARASAGVAWYVDCNSGWVEGLTAECTTASRPSVYAKAITNYDGISVSISGVCIASPVRWIGTSSVPFNL